MLRSATGYGGAVYLLLILAVVPSLTFSLLSHRRSLARPHGRARTHARNLCNLNEQSIVSGYYCLLGCAPSSLVDSYRRFGERTASIFKVENGGTTRFSETSVTIYQATGRHILEGSNFMATATIT
jgi:hypothetical protein